METVNGLNDFFDTLTNSINSKTDCSVQLVIDNSKVEGLYRYSADYERKGFVELFIYYYEDKKHYTPSKTFSAKDTPRKNISLEKLNTLRKKVEKILNIS